uniref:Tyr recombinase domain-containing protein n=1 Tax=Caenorhabditis japonica TaxID=281687 RepID=A0A8R1EKK1_CAEJA
MVTSGFVQRALSKDRKESAITTVSTPRREPAVQDHKAWSSLMENLLKDASTVTERVTLQHTANKELNKLVEVGTVVRTNEPATISPLHVAIGTAGETAIARQRNTSSMVAQAQRAGASEKAEVELSEDSLSLARKGPTSSTTSKKQKDSDFLEGPKKSFFSIGSHKSPCRRNYATSLLFLAQSALLAKAPNTLKAYQAENRLRKAWMAKKDLPEEEQSLLLYLAHRSQVVGSGSIAKAIAAFRMVNNNLSIFGGQLARDLIKSMKKREIESRTQPSQISWTEVEKIVKRVDVQDPKSERNALITLISWTALLRASEAAEIKWTDLKREGDVLEIRVRHAKNDQLAQGRSTFVEYKDGTDLDILLSRWRVRCSEPAFKSDYIFFNLNNREKLSPSAISKVTKETLKNAGVEAQHTTHFEGVQRTR